MTLVNEIAWAAGIFEGEGYTTVLFEKGKKSPRIRQHAVVSIDQKDRWLLDRLQSLFGGSVKSHIVKANSPKNPELRRTYYRWGIYGSRALGFIQTIYMFLSPRRQEQVRNVINQLRVVPQE